ncbi:MAG TPA: G5 domain-containing protein [Clostridia bacterium]|nr:G5 domain-containing protein [Clostridia bacterium]
MEPQQQNMRKNRLLLYVCIVLVIVGGTTTALAHYIQEAHYDVTIDDNGYIAQIQTMDETVKELLDKYEINLGPGDEITPGLEEPIGKDTEIKIRRAFKVTVEADGKMKTVHMIRGTVGDALDKAYVVLGEKDLISDSPDQQASPGDHIRVTRVKEEVLTEKETIPYKVVTKENDKLNKGTEKLVQEGKEGLKEREILIAYHDGHEVNRELVEERVSEEPIDRVIDKGTYVAPPPASRGDVKREKVIAVKSAKEKTAKGKTQKKKVVETKPTKSKTTKANTSKKKQSTKKAYLSAGTYTFQATAYIRTGNRTNSGKWPKEGMIAVDKRLIPLGTKVHVEFPGKWAHLSGYYTAEDTGGAIKGKIIDVFMDTDDESRADKFGRVNNIKVTIP